jgi:hypothetical protein
LLLQSEKSGEGERFRFEDPLVDGPNVADSDFEEADSDPEDAPKDANAFDPVSALHTSDVLTASPAPAPSPSRPAPPPADMFKKVAGGGLFGEPEDGVTDTAQPAAKSPKKAAAGGGLFGEEEDDTAAPPAKKDPFGDSGGAKKAGGLFGEEEGDDASGIFGGGNVPAKNIKAAKNTKKVDLFGGGSDSEQGGGLFG